MATTTVTTGSPGRATPRSGSPVPSAVQLAGREPSGAARRPAGDADSAGEARDLHHGLARSAGNHRDRPHSR